MKKWNFSASLMNSILLQNTQTYWNNWSNRMKNPNIILSEHIFHAPVSDALQVYVKFPTEFTLIVYDFPLKRETNEANT